MAHIDHRSRSNTSMSTKSTRPLSRASTTSIHSFNQHDQQPDISVQYQTQPQQPNSFMQHNNLDVNLLAAAEHASQHEIPDMDTMHQYFTSVQNGQPFDPSQFSQLPPNSQTQQPLQQQPLVNIPAEGDAKKKGSASGSATNDKELREMLKRNEGRALQEVAAEVISLATSSKAEKTKQLFAMLWLKSVCKVAKTSVPRNRVYSKYAERCGTERVIPLNPASFGKLVRVIFPGIQTRRLGVRGESKYHYVDLALITDGEDGEDARRLESAHSNQYGLKRGGSMGPKLDFNSGPRLPADTAAFPAHDRTFESQSSLSYRGTSKGCLYSSIYDTRLPPELNRTTSQMYEYDLKFATAEQMAPEETVAIILPDITPYLPNRPDYRTDSDNAEALVALYRTHCTSLIDAVRYCKEKQFFRLFTSFHGTLTVPVQTLFKQPEIARWITECDWMMYQKMIRNVAQLTLQVAPPQVLKFLDSVEKNLRDHLCKTFHALPLHTLEARLEPSALFTHLLRQMLRVNSTAHAAAVMLMADQNCNRMWEDWSRLVNLKRIVENELPSSCNHDEVYSILSNEIHGMLLPLEAWSTTGASFSEEDIVTLMNETVIDRIAAFLTRLPNRFPHVPARSILQCVNALGSAALREITVENGGSFQGWWLTKVFVDEMCHWLASLGGFLDHGTSEGRALSDSPGLMDESIVANFANGGSGSNNDSRYSSIGADFNATQSFMQNPSGSGQDTGNPNPEINSRRYSLHPEPVSFSLDMDLATSQQEPNHDDSGIALLDEGIDAKFASNMHQTLKSHLTQLPASVR